MQKRSDQAKIFAPSKPVKADGPLLDNKRQRQDGSCVSTYIGVAMSTLDKVLFPSSSYRLQAGGGDQVVVG